MIRLKGISDENWQEIKPTIFPDGTSQVWKITVPKDEKCIIKWNFENEAEVIHVLQLGKLLYYQDKVIKLEVPYFPYARQDKVVGNNSTFAKSVFTDIIYDNYFNEIEAFDIHSKGQVSNVEPVEQIKCAIELSHPDYIFYPDEGAKTRYSHITNQVPSFFGNKVRDQLTGNILEYKIETSLDIKDKTVLIIDDICDFGKTFIESSRKLQKLGAKNIDLYVSHGLFSGGKQFLHDDGIRNIYTTNSLVRNKEGFSV